MNNLLSSYVLLKIAARYSSLLKHITKVHYLPVSICLPVYFVYLCVFGASGEYWTSRWKDTRPSSHCARPPVSSAGVHKAAADILNSAECPVDLCQPPQVRVDSGNSCAESGGNRLSVALGRDSWLLFPRPVGHSILRASPRPSAAGPASLRSEGGGVKN